MKRPRLFITLLFTVLLQLPIYGLGVVEKWTLDLGFLGPIKYPPTFSIGAVGADRSLLLDISGLGDNSYLWIAGNGNLLTNFPVSRYNSIFIDLITSTNLVIHSPQPGVYNQSTNVTVGIFSVTGNSLSTFSTNLTGQGDYFSHDYQNNHPPGYPILVIRGSILHCYAIEGPELAGSISLSDAAVTTNGGFSFHATAFTESPSRLQASPDAKAWKDVGTLYPHVDTLVTAPATNRPVTVFRGIQGQ